MYLSQSFCKSSEINIATEVSGIAECRGCGKNSIAHIVIIANTVVTKEYVEDEFLVSTP